MRKLRIAIILMGISMVLAGCNNVATQNNQKTPNNQNIMANKITVDEAKEIALKHANLTSDQVSFIRSELEVDDGIEKYNVEFYYENKEYDYEINAANGQILEFDYDVESYNISQGQNTNNNQQAGGNTTKITADEAKEIALRHASLASNQVNFERVELDLDDGIQKYDVEFYYNNREYSYEIDANTGNILSYEQD